LDVQNENGKIFGTEMDIPFKICQIVFNFTSDVPQSAVQKHNHSIVIQNRFCSNCTPDMGTIPVNIGDRCIDDLTPLQNSLDEIASIHFIPVKADDRSVHQIRLGVKPKETNKGVIAVDDLSLHRNSVYGNGKMTHKF
jgi:hypothetical protein